MNWLVEKTTNAASESLPWEFQAAYGRSTMRGICTPFAPGPAHLSLVVRKLGVKRLNFTCIYPSSFSAGLVRPRVSNRHAGSGSPGGGWPAQPWGPQGSAPPEQKLSLGASPAPSLVILAPQHVPSTLPTTISFPPAFSSSLASLPTSPSLLTPAPNRGSGCYRTKLGPHHPHAAKPTY